MFEPKATAPHLDSTKLRRTQCEQMSSGFLLKADAAARQCLVRKVPSGDSCNAAIWLHSMTPSA